MKNWKKIVSLVVAVFMLFTSNIKSSAADFQRDVSTSQYVISINGENISIQEGQTVILPMTSLQEDHSRFQTQANKDIKVGNAGILTAWGSGHYLHWTIMMFTPATRFTGTVSSTDINSGLHSGTYRVSGFTGKIYCAAISGHIYSAHLDGIAFNGTTPVATTLFSTVVWKP